MYAHKIIEDLKRYYRILKSVNRSACNVFEQDFIIKMINNSQHFSLGDSGFFDEIGLTIGDHNLFDGDLGDVRIPYNTCFFSYSCNKRYQSKILGEGKGLSLKRAILCNELFEDIIIFYIFNYMDSANMWEISPVASIAYIGSTIGTSKNTKELFEFLEKYKIISRGQVHDNSTSIPIPMFYGLSIKKIIKFHEENAEDLAIINIALLLLGCKNIEFKKNIPDVKLQKARKKRGKLPLFTYHTLVIKPTGNRQESVPKHLWDNRVHLCRGHFKTYTKKKPLFGNITGRFWWQPSVRGQNKNGVVMKDYKVETIAKKYNHPSTKRIKQRET